MQSSGPLIWLTFFTFAAGIAAVGGAFLYFLRRKRNRAIASDALLGDGGHSGSFDGALPELGSVFIFALVMMALLTLGYMAR